MSAYQGFVEETARPVLPVSVRTVRVLLYLEAALSFLLLVGALMSGDLTAETTGLLVWAIWPGFAAFFIARKIHAGGRARFRWIIAIAVLGLLGAFGSIGNGDPRGVTDLVLPIAVLIAVTRRTARDFFAAARPQ